MKSKLTAVAIKAAPDGKLQDGGGLVLIKAGPVGKWVFRYSHLGKRREMGLGNWPTVTLSEARKVRDSWAAELAAGRDPITIRNTQRAADVAARDKTDPTFQELTETVFIAKRDSLRGGGERGRWLSPLKVNVFPVIGRKRVSDITRFDIAENLRPIWRTKHPTAAKCQQRIRLILREGKLMGYHCDPFEADAALRILGDVRHQVSPIVSTPWQEIPALYARLGEGAVADCLRFMILTAMRTEACAGARGDEIAGDVWTVPADRMKGSEGSVKDFRVPLSTAAQALVSRASKYAEGMLFATYTGKRPTSTGLIKRLNGLREAGRPHGFRTTFRTWCQDHDISWDVAETSLGHAIGNQIERSYARSDLLERRRPVLQSWSDYVTGKAATVTQLRGAASDR
ncbi:site-specific integrase [Paracoccus nototheniae]|uniref:Tyrosine-type recombinase/integrase n=1 Tax=Paracoccus nototheniae TaxID=2489002 RepID=A0ABW4DV15_9RHOB|nr:site-specific integrase [Paracoccus nototheniae]